MKCENCKNEPDCKECEKEAFKRLFVLGKVKCSGYEPKTMPDDKLTDVTDNNVGKISDSEIIKALECCSEANNCGQCEYEPTEYQIGTVGCCNELMKDALNLINRLQAEKQNLEIELQAMRGVANSYKAENKRLKVNIDKQKARIIDLSYKEFAKRLKEKVNVDEKDGLHYFYHKQIDNLLKELVGEENVS